MGDPQPVEHIGHQGLEPHVLNARHTFGFLEIGGGGVPFGVPFAGVVDQELRDFA